MSNGHIRVMGQQLVLPFKPFTLDETYAVTGVRTDVLSRWLKKGAELGLLLKQGDHAAGLGHVTGIDYLQLFAIFVGWRWLEEGADWARADWVVKGTVALTPELLDEEFAKGNTFPVTTDPQGRHEPRFGGVLVPAPNSRLGKMLNYRTLLAEFKDRLDRVFAAKTVVSLADLGAKDN